ncbi:MAG: IPTL-CTERM sorting domain-containing protein [Acidobacteria bacterium]|nr:IPTL-CTERM sorting domain-containing protein [Acidobacteriota bacterium]
MKNPDCSPRSYRTALAFVGLTALLCAPSPGLGQTAPPLGQAATFAVLAGSTVTNTGATTIIGDLGVAPGTAVTGFPPGTVTGGTIHINDAVAQQAQSDLTTAYNFVAGQAFNTDLTGQDLGGLTLTPAVYRFSTSAQLTGTLTLDAQGDPNAVFIFQIGSTLTTASNSRVLVINGGSNCSIFWQIGSSATFGTATAFAGNVLALASITLTTGASLSGRALARNGAVTLDTNNAAVCPACSPIVVSPAALPNGSVGTPYSQTISATGGAAPYTFTLISGSLPPGLTLAPSTGLLSGTPTTTGSFTFTVRATDANNCFGSQVYTIVINAPACPTILVSPATLPPAVAGSLYSQTITASGGTPPYVFTITSGALPPGLTLVPSGPSTALLSGTPTSSGAFSFTVTATDSALCFGSRLYTAQVNCPVISLSPATLPNGTLGQLYSQAITATGGTPPYTYGLLTGSLPPGLSLAPATGLISGTPTQAGSFTFTVRATDSVGCFGDRPYTIIINPAICPIISLSPQVLPATVAGVLYSQTITASGGTAPYTFSITAGALPPGLTLVSSGPTTALLSGIPTASGGFNFTLTATDAAGCFGSIIYLSLIACPVISISPATLPAPVTGLPYSQTLTAAGGTAPYTFSVTGGSLPPGLTLVSSGTSTALLSGTPTSTAGFSFTVTATDSAGCFGSRLYSGQAGCPIISISPTSLAVMTAGIPYSQTLTASGGTAPYTFSVTSGALPAGLTLTSSGPTTALISGTPTGPTSASFTITATDAAGCSASNPYSVVVGIVLSTIPTLTEWGLILLAGLVALAGVLVLRK